MFRATIIISVASTFALCACVKNEYGYSDKVLSIIDTLGQSVIDEPWEIVPSCTPDENTGTFNGVEYWWYHYYCDYFDGFYTLQAYDYWSTKQLYILFKYPPDNGIYYTSKDDGLLSNEVYIYLDFGTDEYHSLEDDSVYVQHYDDGTLSVTLCDVLIDFGISEKELNANITYNGNDCD